MTTSKLLLIDSRIDDVGYIINSLTSTTDYIVFDYYSDTFESLISKIIKKYDDVGIIQHNYGICSGYKFLYSMSDDVAETEIKWKSFIHFLVALKENGMKTLDWISCGLWIEPYWKNMIVGIEKLYGIKINASSKEIGNGNYFLDKGEVDLIGKYFVERMMGYNYTFSSKPITSDIDFYIFGNYITIDITSAGTNPNSYITELSYNIYDQDNNNYGNYTQISFTENTIVKGSRIIIDPSYIVSTFSTITNKLIYFRYYLKNNYGEYVVNNGNSMNLRRPPSPPTLELSYPSPNTISVKTNAPVDTGSYYSKYYIKYSVYENATTLVHNPAEVEISNLNPQNYTFTLSNLNQQNTYTLNVQFTAYSIVFGAVRVSSQITQQIKPWQYPFSPTLTSLSTGERSAILSYNQSSTSTGSYPIVRYDVSYTNVSTSSIFGYTIHDPAQPTGTIIIPDLIHNQEYSNFRVLASNKYASAQNRSFITGNIIPIDKPITPIISSASLIGSNVQITLAEPYNTAVSWGLYANAPLSQNKLTFQFNSSISSSPIVIDISKTVFDLNRIITIPVSSIQSIQSNITSISSYAYNGYVNSTIADFSISSTIITDSVSPNVNVAYRMDISYNINSFYPLSKIQYSFDNITYKDALFSNVYYISTSSNQHLYSYPTIFLKYTFSNGTTISSPTTKSSICYDIPSAPGYTINENSSIEHVTITLTQSKIGQVSPNFRYEFIFTSFTNSKINKYEMPVYSGTSTTYTYDYDLSADSYQLELYVRNDSNLFSYNYLGSNIRPYGYPKNMEFTILPNYLSGNLSISTNIVIPSNTGGQPLTKYDILFEDQTNSDNVITYTYTFGSNINKNSPIVIPTILEAKKTYKVKVIAYNQYLNSQNDIYSKTITPYGAPTKPSIKSLTAAGSILTLKLSSSVTSNKYDYSDWGYGLSSQNNSNNKFICILNTTPSLVLDNDSALIVYYPFNDSATETVNKGSTGSTNDCIFYNASITNANYKFGYGSLRGERSSSTNSYISIKNTIYISTQFTQSFWIYVSNGTSNGIELTTYTSSNNTLISNVWWDGYIRFVVGVSDYIRSTTIPAGEWTHLTFTLNSTTMNIYINGVLNITSALLNADWQNKTYDNINICKSYGYWEENEPILYDDFRIYNRELSETEVLSLYNYQYQIETREAYTISQNENVITFPYDSLKYTINSVQVIASNKYGSNIAIYSNISDSYSAAPTLRQIQIEEIQMQPYSFSVFMVDASYLTPITQVRCVLNGTNTFTTTQKLANGYYLFSGLLNGVFSYSSARFSISTREGESNLLNYTQQINVYDYPTPPTIIGVEPGNLSLTIQIKQGDLKEIQTTYNYRIELTPIGSSGGNKITYTTDTLEWTDPETTNTIIFSNVPANINYRLTIFTINFAKLESSSIYGTTVNSYDYPDPPIITSIISESNNIAVSFSPPVNNGGYPIINYKLTALNTSTNSTVESNVVPPTTSIKLPAIPGEIYTNFQLTAQNIHLTSTPATSDISMSAYTSPMQPIIYDVSYISPGVLSIKMNKYSTSADIGYTGTAAYSLKINGNATYTISPSSIQIDGNFQYFTYNIESSIQNVRIIVSNGILNAESSIFSTLPVLSAATYSPCYDTPLSFFVNLSISYLLSEVMSIQYSLSQNNPQYIEIVPSEILPSNRLFKVTVPQNNRTLYYPSILVRFKTNEGTSTAVQMQNIYMYDTPSIPSILAFGISDSSPVPNSLVITHTQLSIGETLSSSIRFTYTFTDDLGNAIEYPLPSQPWSSTTVYSYTATGLSSLRKYRCTIRVNNNSILSNSATTSQQVNPYDIPSPPTLILTINNPYTYNLFIRAPPIEERGGYQISNYTYTINNNIYIVKPNSETPNNFDFNATIFDGTPGVKYDISASTIITYINIANAIIQVRSPFSQIYSIIPVKEPIAPQLISAERGYKSLTINISNMTPENWGYADVSGYMVYIDGNYYQDITSTNATYNSIIVENLEPKLNPGVYNIQLYSINRYFTSLIGSNIVSGNTYKEPSQPNPPSIVSLDKSILLTFNTPNQNNSSINAYKYILTDVTSQINFNPFEFTILTENKYTIPTIDIPNLQINNQYKLTLSARNEGGWSMYSGDSNIIRIDSIPDKPNVPIANFYYGNYSLYPYGYIDVSFIVPESYVSPITEYTIDITSSGGQLFSTNVISLSQPLYKNAIIIYRHIIEKSLVLNEITYKVKVKNAIGYGELSDQMSNKIMVLSRPATVIQYGYYSRSISQLKIRFNNYLFDSTELSTLDRVSCRVGNQQPNAQDFNYLGNNVYECICNINIAQSSIKFTLSFLFKNGVSVSTDPSNITFTPNRPTIKNAIYNPYNNKIDISFNIYESFNFNIPINEIGYSLNNSIFNSIGFTYQSGDQGSIIELGQSISFEQALFIRASNVVEYSLVPNNSFQISFPPVQPTSSNFSCTPDRLALNINISNAPSTQRSFPIISYTYFVYRQSDNNLITSAKYTLLQNQSPNLTINVREVNLIKNVNYYVKLLATNVNGDSLLSIASNAITVYDVPDKPHSVVVNATYKGCSGSFQVGNANSSSIVSSTVVVYSLDELRNINEMVTSIRINAGNAYTITGLIANQLYKVGVYSTNIAGNSDETYSSEFIPFKEPDAPSFTNVIPGKLSLLTEWNSPYDNNSTILGYTLKVYINETTLVQSATINANSDPTLNAYSYTVAGLNANIQHSIILIAFNLGGNSENSEVSGGIPYKEPNPPNPASILSDFLSVKVQLSSIPPYDNSSPITSYKIDLYTLNTFVDSSNVNSDDITTPIVFNNNIIADSPYYVLVYANNAGGISQASNASSTVYPYGYPQLPEIQSIIGGNQQLIINWISPVKNIYNPITNYKYLFRYTKNDTNYELSGNLNASPKTIPNLIANVTYNVFLSSFNGIWAPYSETGVSTVVYKRPEPPTFPTSIKPIIPLLRSAEITFIVPFNNSNQIKRYQFINTITGKILDVPSSDITFFTDENSIQYGKYIILDLTAGITYTYKMTASNDAGESVRSSEMSVIPYKLPELPKITAITPSNESVFISLEINNGYSEITHFYITDEPGISTYEILPVNIVDLNTQSSQQTSSQLKKYIIYVNKTASESNFINGESYTLRLYVSNIAGNSPIAVIPTFTPYGLPDPPIYETSYNEITHLLTILSISSPNDHGSAIRKFQYSLTGSLQNLTGNISTGTQIKLNAGVLYNILFVAINDAGISPASMPFIINTPPDVPDPPVITQINTYANSIDIYFEPSFPSGFAVDSYFYTINSEYADIPFTQLEDVPSNTSLKKYTIAAGIFPQIEYSVSIRSRNQLGYSLYSNIVTITTPNIPSPPVINEIIPYNADIIKIKYTPSLDNGAPILYYHLTISHMIQSNEEILDISINEFSSNNDISINALVFLDDSTYLCKLYAKNRIGNSSSSIVEFGYQLPKSPDFIAVSTSQLYQQPTIFFDLCNNILPFTSYKYKYIGLDTSSSYITTILDTSNSLIVNSKTNKQIMLPILNNSQVIEYYEGSNSYLMHFTFTNAIITQNPAQLYIMFYIYNNTSTFITSEVDMTTIISYLSDTNSLTDYCSQKRMLALYNIPFNRFEIISPYDGTFSREQLDMRRKAEILKYLNNKSSNKTNNMTKKEKYSYSMTNYTNNKGATLAYLVDACMNPACRPPKPSSSSDVHGTTILYEDSNVPLYNFKLSQNSNATVRSEDDRSIPSYVYNSSNLYAYAVTYDISSLEWVIHTKQNITMLDNNVQTVGVLIIYPTISTPQLKYSMNIPVGILLQGTSLDLSNQLYKIEIQEITISVYFNLNKIVETTEYKPSSLKTILFRPTTPIKDFKLCQYLGTHSTQFTIYTSPNYVYNIGCLLHAKITTFDRNGNEIDAVLNVPIQYIFNMDNDKNLFQNIVLQP